MKAVLDASALLAFLQDEPGADHVREVLEDAVISAVNWSEVLQKSMRRHVETVGMREEFASLGLVVEPFSPEQAEIAARLWEITKQSGLSLADRACLSLALERKAPVFTADRAWLSVGLELDIRLIRG
jgi:ribonuclease VapC